MSGAAGLLRTIAFAALGGERLIARYDWLYGWKGDLNGWAASNG
jgi:hypothetical protein